MHSAKAHHSQTHLQIGDKIPDILLPHFLGTNKTGAKLSDMYKKGGLIINFWATWCVPCIKELPVLNELAKKYNSKLSVLSVEYEDSLVVKNFLSKHKDLQVSNLNLITGDTLLVEYLKHRALPYNVWVDSAGIIKHITHGDEINEENVARFLKHDQLSFHEVSEHLNWNFLSPFHLRDTSFRYRSIFTSYTDGILSGNTFHRTFTRTERMINRIFVFNASIAQLYKMAYFKEPNPYAAEDYYNLVEFKVRDSLKYFSPSKVSLAKGNTLYKTKQEWSTDNLYCYELTLPQPIKDSIAFDYMMNDLQRNFNLNCKTELKLKKCSVITLAKSSAIPDKSQKDSITCQITTAGINIERMEIVKIFEFLNATIKSNPNQVPLDPPYINNTGISYPIDINIKFAKAKPSYKEIRDQIAAKYGFIFEQEERLIPVLIISDK